jgi:hypothetical protein
LSPWVHSPWVWKIIQQVDLSGSYTPYTKSFSTLLHSPLTLAILLTKPSYLLIHSCSP